MNVNVDASFKEALKDYLYLRNRQYPAKSALKLIGDRYRLSGTQRMILYRGVVTHTDSKKRKNRIIPVEQFNNDLPLLVDGYNVLFTLLNYMLGRPLFVSLDGLLRDCGNGYGQFDNSTHLNRAVELLISFINVTLSPQSAIYLDAPVNGSSRLAENFRERMSIPVLLSSSADQAIREATTPETIIATSDSGIIDATHPVPIFDAARYIMERNFTVDWFHLESLLGE